MEAKPIKKEFVERAKALNVSTIQLAFEGGSDEGYLEVNLSPTDYKSNMTPEEKEVIRRIEALAREIEEWTWEVYSYSGAGEGLPYGDNVYYDIQKGTVTTTEWYTNTVDGESSDAEMEVVE